VARKDVHMLSYRVIGTIAISESRVTQYTLADGYPLLLFLPLCVLVPPLEVHTLYFDFIFLLYRYVNCVSVILNYTYVMWTSLCIIMIVLLQFHCGFRFAVSILVLHAVNTCCVLWRILLRWCYDIMISPLRILVINFLKSIPHRAVGASLFRCCCCYSRYCFRDCVIIFCSIFDSSFSSFCRRCLYLVVAVATLGDRTLSWVRFDWCFVLITGITRTSCCSP